MTATHQRILSHIVSVPIPPVKAAITPARDLSLECTLRDFDTIACRCKRTYSRNKIVITKVTDQMRPAPASRLFLNFRRRLGMTRKPEVMRLSENRFHACE